jgi:hypothetical protein
MLEMELADRFNISQSTISRLLIGWLNYLYFFLGSVPIWPSCNDVDKHMLEIFKPDYVLTRVVIDYRIICAKACQFVFEFGTVFKL